jgi:hypothetical protein
MEMAVMIGWSVFREIYFKIIFSILVVIGAMLLLQSSLNQLKLRALVAEATSSRLQISAAAIEAAIVRADALGFSIDEMVALQDLIDRERSRDPSIVQVLIVSPIGAPIFSAGSDQLLPSEREPVLRRIFGSGDSITRIDMGQRLYTGRLLYDSSDAVMGAVILTTPTESFIRQARRAFRRMTNAYLFIFMAIGVLIVPFIVFQFSSVRHAYRALDPDGLTGEGAFTGLTQDTRELRRAISYGNAAFADAEEEFDALLISEGSDAKGAST